MTCKNEGCPYPVRKRGMCGRCYNKAWRMGAFSGDVSLYNKCKSFFDAALKYEGDECLIWPYSRKSNGYGSIWHNNRKRTASNLMCEVVYGPPPPNKREAAHSCHTPACINPRHLRWASAQENTNDKMARLAELRPHDH